MGWKWVRHIKTNENDYYFAVPGGLVYNGPTGQTIIHSIYIGGLYGDTGTAYRDGVAAIDFMTSQEEFPLANIDYKDGEGSGYTIFYGSEGSGARFYFNPDNYPSYFQRTYYTFKNFTPYPIVTAWSGGFPNGRQDYTVGAEGAFFCCAVNDDTRELYFGLGTYGHYYYPSSPTYYYNGASIDISMLDFYSTANLYDAFEGCIDPGGGGGGSNPYADGGYSEPGGGEEQNFDEVSDTIDLPALPIYGATGSGFVTAFCPTVGQINSVADYLITPNVAQVIQGLFVKLSDVIIGLHLLPFVVNAANKKNIEIKNLAFTINTGVESYYADNQYQRLDMGTVDVLKCWDNCLDYNPYTFVSIYLPFCGYFELDTDEVMGKTLHVIYDVDIITGSCVALIQIDGSVMYQFSGMCSCQIPITSVDFNQAVQSLIGLGASAAAGIKMIKGAATATEEAASVAMAPTTKNSVRQAAYENYMEAKMNEQEIKESVASRLANASVNAVISGKGNYMHAGAVSSAPGFLACRKPFLIIKRPKQSVPEDYESMRGFPSNMKATLGDLSGYTEVEDIHLNIPDATVDEIVECERLLKGGVYL